MKQKPAHKKIVRLALIGAGGIGAVWASGIQKAHGVKLVAVVDTDTKRAAALAKQFPACAMYSNPKEVFRDKNIDAVIVATPHMFLAPLSHAALKAGKHVLCEKPAGIASKEIQQNLQLAAKNKRIYMVGFNHRFHAAFLKAKEISDKEVIGKLLCIRARYGFGGRPGYNREWRFNKKIAGGGELLDQGIHMLDISSWFLGEFAEVQGFTENFFWGGGVEDNAFVTARTKKGAIAQIHASWTNWDWIHCFEIFGTKGYLRIDGLDSRYHGPERLTIGTHDPQVGTFPKEKIIMFGSERKEDSFARELGLFADVVRGKRRLYPSGQDALQSLILIERVYKQNNPDVKSGSRPERREKNKKK